MITTVYYLTVKFSTPTKIGYTKANQATTRQFHFQSLQLSRQAIVKPTEVVTRDVLAIEWDGYGITLDNPDLWEENPKPELVERIKEV